MRCVINEAAPKITDIKIHQDYWQQPRAESTLEAFGQFAPVLNAENEKRADQTEERARRPRRGTIPGPEKKTPDRASSHFRPDAQITCQDTDNACHDPEHYEFGRAVKTLDIRAEHPQAIHIDE